MSVIHQRIGPACAALVGILLLSTGAPAVGQQEPHLPPELTAMIEAYGGFTAKQLVAVERGEVVASSLTTPDHNEVALLALVAVDVPRSFYLDRAREPADFLAGPMRSALGIFHEPATPADEAALSLDASDVDALQNCRPSRCQVKLPASTMERVRGSVAWARDASAQVNTLMREWLAGVVNDYRARGDSALPVYDDTRAGESSGDGFHQLLDENARLLRDAPSVAAHLRQPPTTALDGATTSIYWAVDRLPGLKPTLSVGQLSTYAPADAHMPAFIATKQLYASHYFDAFLDVVALVERPAPRTGTYVVLLRRVRFDELPRGGLFNLRARVVRKLRDGVLEELARTKQTLEAASKRG